MLPDRILEFDFANGDAPGELDPSHHLVMSSACRVTFFGRHSMKRLKVAKVGPVKQRGVAVLVEVLACRSSRLGVFEKLVPAPGLHLETDGVRDLAGRMSCFPIKEPEGRIVIPADPGHHGHGGANGCGSSAFRLSTVAAEDAIRDLFVDGIRKVANPIVHGKQLKPCEPVAPDVGHSALLFRAFRRKLVGGSGRREREAGEAGSEGKYRGVGFH